MRIVIDLQGAQTTGSRDRGIGRYSMALTEALVRLRGQHEVLLVLNGMFPETIESIRCRFDAMLPQQNIRVWAGIPGVAELGPEGNAWRRGACELLREAFISDLRPDVVLVTSLFEGLVDDAVTSLGKLVRCIPTAVVIYDLIPLLNRHVYLENPTVEAWYERKLGYARNATILLAISESSRKEAIEHLGTPREACVAISTAADPRFAPIALDAAQQAALRGRYGLVMPFVMYTGGIDHRKNIEGLIRAFARVPTAIRTTHQLAIVCSIQTPDRTRLSDLAASIGLHDDAVVFTGFVSDDDLLGLYNLCALFVFPSWHEGFGLPALEAMSCGRAVIAANTSSLPEVVGRDDAMFDPFDDDAIAGKIAEVLENPTFRRDLEDHGLRQARRFSWDNTGRMALSALERMHSAANPTAASVARPLPSRPRLALVSPLQPERSGISNYVAELLPELARHYEIELVGTQREVSDPWARAHCLLRSPDWLVRNAHRFERVLYHFGNSHLHRDMFELLDKVPGIVVLHDFYLGHLVEHMHGTQSWPGDRAISLYRSHGYGAAAHATVDVESRLEATWDYPCNLKVLQQARGVIVHSLASCRLAETWYGEGAAQGWEKVPFLRAPLGELQRKAAREALGLAEDEFVVCSFGVIGLTKSSQRLLTAWQQSKLGGDPRCRLVFVGQNDSGAYGAELAKNIHDVATQGRVSISGWVDSKRYRQFLAAADLAVQLRERSRGETSGAVFDCLNAGLATVANAHGSLAELPDDAVWKLEDAFSNRELQSALETLRSDGGRRLHLAQRGREEIAYRHTPRHCAALYADAIERIIASRVADTGKLTAAVVALKDCNPDARDWLAFARAAALSLAPRPSQAQLLVDVSVLAQVDAGTGIQRVVRSILKQWLTTGVKDFRIEPVYAADDGGYRYARRFTMEFLGVLQSGITDQAVDARVGDVFVGLDLNPNLRPEHLAFQQNMRRMGVSLHFIVYDLLPVLLPHRFWEEATRNHQRWLMAVAEADRAICISRAVADELFDWLQTYGPKRQRPLDIEWFHLGSDVVAPHLAKATTARHQAALDKITGSNALLMVGTLEPRKRHDQVLDAMEILWERGNDLMLVLVGKPGWGTDDLIRRLRTHPESGRRLLWLEYASDELLEQVYRSSSGLIAASEGEGFGLNLVEAARYGLPLFVRDIPVFREVAGEHATFFKSDESNPLAIEVMRWAAQLSSGDAVSPAGLSFLTWAQSAQALVDAIRRETPYRRWQREDRAGEDRKPHTSGLRDTSGNLGEV